MEDLTAEDFSKHLNSRFGIYRSDEMIFEAELVEATELRNNGTLYCFSLVFLLPAEFGYEQRLYKLEHSELGTMELFMVPIGQTEAGIRFEAVFNRIVQK